ncbi:MAG TPA: glycosyltransferase family 9 protein [Ktedonobacterales bacterium]|jgi:ADP-heptose:LPS heptosyltransferase|nr:glycosyltransferase family 9 protein [Ktedonobacterales bacterium]
MPDENLYGDPRMPGLLHRLPEPPRKVALLRASRIGDFLCATPAFRALRAALPEADITMITLPLLRGLVARSHYLDRYAAFPGFPGIAEQIFDARRAVEFFREMQRERFDLAIQMQGSGVYSNPFTLMLGARTTAGFIRDSDGPGLLDATLPIAERGLETQRVLALTTFLGAPPQGVETRFPLWREDHAEASALLTDAEPPLLGLHAGARDLARRWPPERFAAVGAALYARYGGALVLLGDAETVPASTRIAERLAHERVPCLDLTGRTSLPTLGAVIARLALLVTNDSGPAHIAYALEAPSVTIVGGVNPEAYAPPAQGPHWLALHDVPCRPSAGLTCQSCAYNYACLDGVSVAQVLSLAERAMCASSGDLARHAAAR